jgi:hypothetical protein
VSLIHMAHLDLHISPRIFEKILNDPIVIFRDERNLKQKIS